MIDKQRLKDDILYRFFTNEIDKITSQIQDNKRVLKKLTDTQMQLKRGKSELVRLRRELDNKGASK